MPDTIKYGVKFIGYGAFIVARKNECDVNYARLDFEGGGASIMARRGVVTSPGRLALASLVRSLPRRIEELEGMLRRRDPQVPDEAGALLASIGMNVDVVTLSIDESTICIEASTNLKQFIRQVSRRFTEVERILEKAEEIGSKITRRPYSEFISGIQATGFAAVEAHGTAVFRGGKLIFHPAHQVCFTRPSAPMEYEIIKPKSDSDPVH